MVRFASAILAGLLGLMAAASAQVTVLSPAQQCVASANAGGTANALTIPLLPCGASTNILLLNVTKTNTGSAPTLQMLGFAAHPIVASNGGTVPAGALVAGDTVMLNSQGQNWRLLTRSDVLTNALTDDTVWIGNTSNQAEAQTVSGDITLSRTGLATLAPMPAHTFKGNPENVTAVPVNMNATTSTAELNSMIGDSGAGGTKGLAPAPASGDAAAGKFLKADGTWATVAGAGGPVGLSLSYTGNWIEDGDTVGIAPVPTFTSESPFGILVEGEFFTATATGAVVADPMAFAASTVYPGLTSLTFNNLSGTRADFGAWGASDLAAVATLSAPELAVAETTFEPTNLPALQSMSFPKLRATGVDFQPYGTNLLTTLDFPLLKRVGREFDPGPYSLVAEMSFPSLVSVGGNFFPASMPSLGLLDFPALELVYRDFKPQTFAGVHTASFASLQTVGGNFEPHHFDILTSLSFPALTRVYGFVNPHDMAGLQSFSMTGTGLQVDGNMRPLDLVGLKTLDLSGLTILGGNFEPQNTPTVSSISLTALQSAGSIVLDSSGGSFNGITGLTFPALRTAISVSLNNMTGLTSVSFGAPVTLPQIDVSVTPTNGVPNLVDFAITTTGIKDAGSVKVLNTKLSQVSVDAIIHALYLLDGTGGTTIWRKTLQLEGANTLSPSAPGLSEANAICARGGGVFVRLHGGTLCS